MMLFTLAITVGFGSSDRLAGAYGTAVSTTMLLTTALLYKVMRDRWRWSAASALAVSGAFLVVDFAFFSANLLKIKDGGWVPLVFAALIFLIMTTWHFGVAALRRKLAQATEAPEVFFQQLGENKIPRVPGTAIFLTRLNQSMPPLFVQHVTQIGALHQTLIALTVQFEEVPRIHAEHRVEMAHLAEDFWHLTVRYGFVEIPNLSAVLRQAKDIGCPIDLDNAIFFGERDEVVRRKGRGRLARWRVPLFAFMFRNSVHAADRFNIPSAKLVEISRRIEI
jgi:KUP system potassium uptake protein